MRKTCFAALICMALISCQTPEGGVLNKVLTDFGLREKPEGYVSESDKVFEALNGVGGVEMKRMNTELQHGTVKFQKDGELKGKYYKEVKVYESYYPVDAQKVNRSGESLAGFEGYLEYAYRMYQSPRKDSGTEAEAATAGIPTDETGRDKFRYTFTPSGEWNGSKGEKVGK